MTDWLGREGCSCSVVSKLKHELDTKVKCFVHFLESVSGTNTHEESYFKCLFCSLEIERMCCGVVWCGVRWCVGLWHVVFIVIATSRERSVCCVVLTDDSHKQREECVLCCVD